MTFDAPKLNHQCQERLKTKLSTAEADLELAISESSLLFRSGFSVEVTGQNKLIANNRLPVLKHRIKTIKSKLKNLSKTVVDQDEISNKLESLKEDESLPANIGPIESIYRPSTNKYQNKDTENSTIIMTVDPVVRVINIPQFICENKHVEVRLPSESWTSVYKPQNNQFGYSCMQQSLIVRNKTKIPVPENKYFDHFNTDDLGAELKVIRSKNGRVISIEVLPASNKPILLVLFYTEPPDIISRLPWIEPESIPDNLFFDRSWAELGFAQKSSFEKSLIKLENQKDCLTNGQIICQVETLIKQLRIPYKHNKAIITDHFENDLKESLGCIFGGKGGVCNDMARVCYAIAAKLSLKVVLQPCINKSKDGKLTNKKGHIFVKVWNSEENRWIDWETTRLCYKEKERSIIREQRR